MAFPMYQEWYLIEHDALVRLVEKHTNWLHAKSWQEDGNLHLMASAIVFISRCDDES